MSASMQLTEVSPGGNNLGVNVLLGTDVFGISMAAGNSSLVAVDSTVTKGAKREISGETESDVCTKKAKKSPRATRHTYAGDKVPLLLKMNALFVQEVKKKGYLPRELPDV